MPATLSELEQQNPNIGSQIEVWQRERVNNGQSPADWEAFRQHAMAIGAPDPGEEAPSDFAQSAKEASSAAARSKAAEQQAQQPAQSQQSAQPQAPVQQPQQPQQAAQPPVMA